MKVDTNEVNPAFQSIIQNPGQKVFLGANFFIPPDRSDVAKGETLWKTEYYKNGNLEEEEKFEV